MITLETFHRRAIANAECTPLEYVCTRFWDRDEPAPWSLILSGDCIGTVDVILNHGQWQTDCPVEGCNGSTLASDTDHRFVCKVCALGPLEVIWPADRSAIEAALEPRPVIAQNWTPADSVDELLEENAARGV